jgi:hypothetical protein
VRRLLRIAGAALLTSSAVVLVWPAGAVAQAPDAKGWWFRPQQSGTPVGIPAPPIVPPGGLYVAQGPNNEQVAVAAVEYRVAGPSTSTLTLKPAPGAVGTVAVTACPLTAGFTPVEAGAWDKAPAYNCTSSSADGVAAPDGSITFALTADFVAAGATAVQAALIPTPGSAPFQAPIEAPADDSFAAVAAPVADASSADASAGDPVGAGPSGTFDGVATPFAPFNGSLDTTGTVAPSAPPEVALRPPTPRLRPALPVVASRQLADRVAAVVALAVIGAAMWWMGGRPLPSPRLLGGTSTGAVDVGDTPTGKVGGIGRFARPRSAPPNRF